MINILFITCVTNTCQTYMQVTIAYSILKKHSSFLSHTKLGANSKSAELKVLTSTMGSMVMLSKKILDFRQT
jgi:hypothetical protein